MTNLLKFREQRSLALAAATLAIAANSSFAATITVPTQQPNLAAAITAANTGDDIRVRNDYVETTSSITISGKSLTIRSYDSSYSTPQSGAQWILASGGGGASGGLILLQSSASLTFEGFSQVTVPGGNAFLVGGTSTLSVANCSFSGIVLSNTAAVKADSVSSVTVTVTNTTFSANGRSIWYNNVTGGSSLNLDNTTFATNSSYPVEFRTLAGSHSLTMTDCSITQATNNPTRLYFFGTTGGATTNNTVNIDRCRFTLSGTASTPVILGGIVDTASASSTADVMVTNCVMDLRSAAATGNGVGSLSDQPNRKSNVTVRHCTIVTGNASQAGIYQYSSTNPGAWSIGNSIIDGAGAALKNDGPGTMTSGKNLLNTAAGITSGTGTASITLSGSEITGQSPQFVNGSGGDFHLLAASPARNVGLDLGITTDLDGNTRPFESGPDLGAYERVVAAGVDVWNHYD